MLLKRVDVTLESFLWAERSIGREGEVAAAIQSQRQTLADLPMTFTIQDALLAPVSLISESSERVTECKYGILNKSLVKSVLIGPVPDRGGRATALRTKISDRPSNKSHHGGKNQAKSSAAPISDEKMEISVEDGTSGNEVPKGRTEGEHRKVHWKGKGKHKK